MTAAKMCEYLVVWILPSQTAEPFPSSLSYNLGTKAHIPWTHLPLLRMDVSLDLIYARKLSKIENKATNDSNKQKNTSTTHRKSLWARSILILTQQFLIACREALLPRELSLLGDSAHKGVARSAGRHSVYYSTTRHLVPRIIAYIRDRRLDVFRRQK